MNFLKTFLVVFGISVLIMGLGQKECRGNMVEVVPVEYRELASVISIVETMLSAEGKISADTRTNSLIIVDNVESIQKIKLFLKDFDKPVQQFRIRVRFGKDTASKEGSMSANGRISDNGWTVSTRRQKKNGIDVMVNNQRIRKQENSEYFINVVSGSPAYILTGEDIPFRQIWITLSRRYARINETISFKKIETGMEVTPTIAGGNVHIEILPRISEMGSDNVIYFTRAKTSLTVPLDKWIDIGGTTKDSNEVMYEIFGVRSKDHRSSILIAIMVEKYQ